MPSPTPSREHELDGPPFVARIGPGAPLRRWALTVVALLSAVPTLVWALTGAQFLHDDWDLALQFGQGDAAHRWSEFWVAATQHPARPGAALYYLVTYGALGMHPVLHALLLAVICGVLGILVFLVAERLWRTDIAIWIALVYAVLPNRGSTRLWFAVATNPLAVVLLLCGMLLLLRGRPLLAGLALAGAVLTYEAVFGLALLAIAVWVLVDLTRRWKVGAVVAACVVAAGGLLYLISPKRTGGTHVGGFGRMMSSQFGVGLFEWSSVARLAPVVLTVGLLLVVVLHYRQQRRYRGVVISGFVLLLAGWFPFFMTDWPIATDGFFDRANGVVGLGTAVLLGALLSWLVLVVPRPAGAAVAVVVVGFLLTLNVIDVDAFRKAADQGNTLLAHVADDVPAGSEPLRVAPPPGAVRGVEQFPAGHNLSSALQFRRGDWVAFWIDPGVEEAPPPADGACYDPTTRTIAACPAP